MLTELPVTAAQGILARPIQDQEDEDGGGVAHAGERSGWCRVSQLRLPGCSQNKAALDWLEKTMRLRDTGLP